MADYFVDETEEGATTKNLSAASGNQRPPGQLAVCVVGKSNSGKSYLTAKIVQAHADKTRPVYVLNFDKSRGEICPYVPIEWTRLSRLENCSLIIEDFIATNKKNVEEVYKTLNHSMSHKNISLVVLVGHQITNTRIYSMLSFFDLVYVSALPSSYSFFSQLLRYFGFAEAERQRYVECMKNVKENFRHFVIDVRNHTVALAEFGGGEDQRRKKALAANVMQSASRYLTVLGNEKKERALAVFEIIFAKCKKIDGSDLSIKIKNRNGKVIKISVVDYIDAVIDVDGPKKEENTSLCLLHDFLQARGVILPRSYVKNRNFW